MTREEVIRIATGLRTDFKCESETMVDFCNTIIKLVRQEPCEDAISRKAVLDTLDTTDKFLDEDRTVEHYKALLKESYEVLSSVTLQEPEVGH